MIRAALVVAAVCLAGCPPSGAPQPIPPGPPVGPGYQPGAAIGAACDSAGDCASGLCEGQGCGPGGGVCADPARVCTADVVEYCGCDGRMFTGSSSCPGARFDHPGACAPAGAADGAACLDGAECASGICEGQGCGPDSPGVCASAQRMCTMDSRPYCGCDGETFRASGTCANRRYQAKAPCAPPQPKPGGAACLQDSECESGACEGEGCGDDTPGVCAAVQRRCTRDARAYCGCDGKTFRGSGTCPGHRYLAKGTCESQP